MSRYARRQSVKAVAARSAGREAPVFALASPIPPHLTALVQQLKTQQ